MVTLDDENRRFSLCDNCHKPIFSNEKPSNISDEEWNLLHRQVCGYIRMWVDDNVLNHIIGETYA